MSLLNEMAAEICRMDGRHFPFWRRGGRVSPVVLWCPVCQADCEVSPEKWAEMKVVRHSLRGDWVLNTAERRWDAAAAEPMRSVLVALSFASSSPAEHGPVAAATGDLNAATNEVAEAARLGFRRRSLKGWRRGCDSFALSRLRLTNMARASETQVENLMMVMPLHEAVNTLGWLRLEVGLPLDGLHHRTIGQWHDLDWLTDAERQSRRVRRAVKRWMAETKA